MAKVDVVDASDAKAGATGGGVAASPATGKILAVGLGRGSAGKSTALAEIVQRARAGGRSVAVADGDVRSRTLSGLFPDASSPPSEEMPDVKEWISGLLDGMAGDGVAGPAASLALDLGGGDRVLLEYGRDLELVEFCACEGIEPLAVYVLGPDPEDLEHCLSIWRRGYFRPDRALLVFNEGVVKAGTTVAGAFSDTLAHPGLAEMEKAGARAVTMPKLACMAKVRKAGLDFHAAAEGRGPGALGPTDRFMVRRWLRDLEEARRAAGVDAWLP